MRPFSILCSEAALKALGSDSLVCPPFHPESVYQKYGADEWAEPGVTETAPTSALWEVMTGSYDGYIPDEEREVWVLYDAAHKSERPPREKSSPDYATRVQAREPEMVHHATLAEARTAIEAAIGAGTTTGPTNIWHRAPGAYEFRPSAYIGPGTTVSEFPWNSSAVVTLDDGDEMLPRTGGQRCRTTPMK